MSSASAVRLAQRVLSPELEFMRLLWAVEHGLQTTSKRMARRIGVTGPQRFFAAVPRSLPVRGTPWEIQWTAVTVSG